MTKQEFLNSLEKKLYAFPKEEKEERISFYSEMIDDRMQEGKSEEEAINELGGVDKVLNDILEDTTLISIVKERVKPKRRMRPWEIIFLILGFPLWFPLLIVFILLCLIGYLLVWIGVIVCYAIEAGLGAAAIYSLVGFFYQLFIGNFSLTYFGGFMMSVGGAFLFIFACIGVTKATIKLSKATIRHIKSWFMKKEA